MSGNGDEALARQLDWRAILLGVLALLGALVLVALVNLQMSTDRERDEALAKQARTYEVIIRAGQLSTTIAQAESSLGRYVVSADKAIGRQYADAMGRATDQIERLDATTRDDPALQQRIGALRSAFNARSKELNETALYSVFKRDRDALGAYYQVSDTQARAALETRLTAVVDRERDLLGQRKLEAAALLASSRTTTTVLAIFGLLTVLGSIVLGALMVQAVRERAHADADAAASAARAGQLHEAVVEATAQLREEAREREQAEERLRQSQKMEAVGQLTGGIAHDFNNMLAVVLGGLELAKRHLHQGGTDAARHIENAMEGANRAATLTRRLLVFSREEALLPASVEAGKVIHGMSDLLDRTLGDQVTVETRDQGLGWRVWIDRHQLENTLLNLAVNARDAMDGRGTLTIATGGAALGENEVGENAAGDYVVITVSDTGSGMTPEVLERVFEPFFTTKPVGKGTGLGLSQIFGFVRQSGGEIAIDTEIGLGTSVKLYLPRYTGEAVAEEDAEAHVEAEGGERVLDILVVEDDPRVLNATVSALTELGHRVTSIDDPLAAPAAIDRLESLDLVVSDVLMPGQTGPEMIAALEPRLAGVGVLFLTGFAGEAGADAFGGHPVLRKPYTMAALARAVAAAAAPRSM
ncbi:ATP-binding protein [Sphingomonas sp.]|uniref:ATP-binding protein n=1 Tax=Sphingomonas sp. TaxID=28214 RepID=UPI001B0CF16B|nr:ATP-binding protein [Sphingomonas sp.]MBO9714296.1 response regulator [Sphingomonas sp.]